MSNNVSITTNRGQKHSMSLETYSRWLCLVEALDVISRAAELHNINLDKRTDLIKPLAIQKYINERFPGMHHDIQVEERLDLDLFQSSSKRSPHARVGHVS